MYNLRTAFQEIQQDLDPLAKGGALKSFDGGWVEWHLVCALPAAGRSGPALLAAPVLSCSCRLQPHEQGWGRSAGAEPSVACPQALSCGRRACWSGS